MSKTNFFFHENFEENKKKQRFNTGIFVTNQDVGVKTIRAHDHLLNIIKTWACGIQKDTNWLYSWNVT